MKKEKGFTLIELLAVIIILGVLMLVAIPSVTSYINNSRKSAYADTAANYIKGATNLVNEGVKVQFYDEGILYMVPAGHDKNLSCVALESGGQSPYNNKYLYAYVGVTYDNEKGTYSYYWVDSDGAGQGFEFTDSYSVASSDKGKGSALVKAGLAGKYKQLKAAYTGSGDNPTPTEEDITLCVQGASDCTGSAPSDELLAAVTALNNGIDPTNRLYISRVKILAASSCQTALD